MQFLADVTVRCDVCDGRRFQSRTLADATAAQTYVDREWTPDKVRQRYEWLFTYDVTKVAV